MDVWSGANATNALHETIKTQIVAMDRQSKAIACLTKIMLVLAVVQTLATVVQAIPIVQGFQNQQAANNLPNSTGKLNQQQTQPQPVIHATPARPPAKP